MTKREKLMKGEVSQASEESEMNAKSWTIALKTNDDDKTDHKSETSDHGSSDDDIS